MQTAKSVTRDDALRIVRGSETAVTEYFETKTRQPPGERNADLQSYVTGKTLDRL